MSREYPHETGDGNSVYTMPRRDDQGWNSGVYNGGPGERLPVTPSAYPLRHLMAVEIAALLAPRALGMRVSEVRRAKIATLAVPNILVVRVLSMLLVNGARPGELRHPSGAIRGHVRLRQQAFSGPSAVSPIVVSDFRSSRETFVDETYCVRGVMRRVTEPPAVATSTATVTTTSSSGLRLLLAASVAGTGRRLPRSSGTSPGVSTYRI
jgi:hypothetical protein